MISQPFFTIQELASRWGVSESAVFSLGANGSLQFGIFVPGFIHVEIGSHGTENHEFEVESAGFWSGFIPIAANMVTSVWQNGKASRLTIPDTDCGKVVRVVSDIPFDEFDQSSKLFVAQDDLEKFELTHRVAADNNPTSALSPCNELNILAGMAADEIRKPGEFVTLNDLANHLTKDSVRKKHKNILHGQKGWHGVSWIKAAIKGWQDPLKLKK